MNNEITGQTLSRTLLRHGIKTTVYDKSPVPTTTPRHSYGLTLLRHPTWRDVSSLLEDDTETILATKGENIQATNQRTRRHDHDEEIRIHRARLEKALAEHLDIKWGNAFKDIQVHKDGPTRKIQIKFNDESSETADIVIATDGIHSTIRKKLLPHVEADVLPFVVFRGKRKLSAREWLDLEPYMNANQEAAAWTSREGQRLEVKLDEWKSEDEASVSYTYSRPAQQNGSDALHKPGRNNDSAKQIPVELFDEIAALTDMPAPFVPVYDIQKVRKDRLLHWLMRTLAVPDEQLTELATSSGVLLIGEAARATPILGGSGANYAIQDGKELADFIAGVVESSGHDLGVELSGFYNKPYWRSRVIEQSEGILIDLHDTKKSIASGKL